MTAIAWSIFIYAVISDPNMKDASEGDKGLAYGLSTFGLLSMIILTIKDIIR